jgi:hypothetical protein
MRHFLVEGGSHANGWRRIIVSKRSYECVQCDAKLRLAELHFDDQLYHAKSPAICFLLGQGTEIKVQFGTAIVAIIPK